VLFLSKFQKVAQKFDNYVHFNTVLGIMNYGTLLSTREGDVQFLIRIEEMQINLMQITRT